MNISFLITLGMTLEFQNFDDVDSVLSILEHLIVIASIIITPYLTDKIRKHET